MQKVFQRLGVTLAVLGVMAPPLAGFAAEENFLMVTMGPSKEPTVKALKAKIFIDAPPEIVWDNITDYQELKTVMPGYEKCQMVKNAGGSKILDIVQKVAPFLPAYKYQVQVRENRSAYQINLSRISGDFKKLNAVYKLVPQDNGRRTLLTYDLSIDPGNNLPGTQNILKSNTEKSMKAIERHIEQEYRTKQISSERD